MSTSWFFHQDQSSRDGEYITILNPFEGVLLRVKKTSAQLLQSISALRFRVHNKAECEPVLEGEERRFGNIIQIYPREFTFSSAAFLKVTFPSCVKSAECGQLVCMYSRNPKNEDSSLRWKPIDSECFRVNDGRTCGVMLCRHTGLYCFKVTHYPEVTKLINPATSSLLRLKERSGVELSLPQGCAPREISVTLKVIYLEDLYKVPCDSPVSPIIRLVPSLQEKRDNGDVGTLDVCVSPIVLVIPLKYTFSKPLKLTLPLLGEEFESFFLNENARFVALRSPSFNEDQTMWKHHFSTPEVSYSANIGKVGSFLITRGGLYKLARRISASQRHFIEQISSSVSREVCHFVTSSNFVPIELRVMMTEIAEPGKQFVLTVALFDSKQTYKPDVSLVSELCSQPITLPLGKVRVSVSGKFQPDLDAVDHKDDKSVMFTGVTKFVDFNLKLKLSDPSKMPDVMGKVTIQGEKNIQYCVVLKKPSSIDAKRPSKFAQHLNNKHQSSSLQKKKPSVDKSLCTEKINGSRDLCKDKNNFSNNLSNDKIKSNDLCKNKTNANKEMFKDKTVSVPTISVSCENESGPNATLIAKGTNKQEDQTDGMRGTRQRKESSASSISVHSPEYKASWVSIYSNSRKDHTSVFSSFPKRNESSASSVSVHSPEYQASWFESGSTDED